MNLSIQGFHFLEREEGNILHVYLDQVGNPTIGIGHLLRPGEVYLDGITAEESLSLFMADSAWVEDTIAKFVKAPLSQWWYDGLFSLVFNIGAHNFIHSTVLARLNQGDYAGAARAFKQHVRGRRHGVLEYLPVLDRRRGREINLILRMDYGRI